METVSLLGESRDTTAELNNSFWRALGRGHRGKVNCVAASLEVDYIVSGGDDGTTRIWGYDDNYQSYDLIALVQHSQSPRPISRAPSEDPTEVSDSKVGVVSLEPQEERKCVDVTAVACTGSRSSISAGEWVTVDVDEDYIKTELEYQDDLNWDDRVQAILGERLEVLSVDWAKETIVLTVDPSLTESVEFNKNFEGPLTEVELPILVVERDRKFTVRDGPFISGTAKGDVSILCLMCEDHEAITLFRGVHQGAVNDIAVIPSGNDLVVITAGQDGVAALLTLLCKEEVKSESGDISLKLQKAEIRNGPDGCALRFEHKREGQTSPVLQVKALGERLESHDRISFASLTCEGVHLWSATGTELMVLTIHAKSLMYDPIDRQDKRRETKVSEYTGLAAVSKDTGSLLLASGDGFVGTWFVDDGMVTGSDTLDQAERLTQWDKDLERYKDTNVGIKPMAVYEQVGTLLDVDQAGSTATFAVDLRENFACSLWKLESISPDFLAVDPSTLANSLIMPGRETIQLELMHSARVCHLRAANDPDEGGAGGPAVITGCEDGNVIAWDVVGVDKGQKYAEMRSLTFFEYVSPPLLLLVSALQIITFAFGPSIPWREEVRAPVAYVRTYAVFDFEYKLNIEKETIFWLKTTSAVAIMCFFLAYSFAGGYGACEAFFRYMQNTPSYKGERESYFQPTHYALASFKRLATLAHLLVYLVSTVGMVPLAKTIAKAVDCVPHHVHDTQPCIFGGCKLASAPTVECYRGDHWSLVWKLFFLFPTFLYTAVPIAACAGDSSYVPFNTLVDWRVMWWEAARRKATDLHLGYLHPRPGAAFSMHMMDLASRVLLPFITIETTRFPIFQMAAVSALGAASLAHALYMKPYVDEKYLCFVIVLKVYTLLVMYIGLLSAVLDDPSSQLPGIVLACVTLLTLIFGSMAIWFSKMSLAETKVFKCA